MRRHEQQRKGGWPPSNAQSRDHQHHPQQVYHRGGTGTQPAAGAVSAVSAAEPGTNPQPAQTPRRKSQAIAKRFTRQAFNALADVMEDQEAAATARVNAANTILEWGHGRRGESAKAPKVIAKTIRVDWGKE